MITKTFYVSLFASLFLFISPTQASAAIVFGGITSTPGNVSTTSISWTGPAVSGTNTIGWIGVWVQKAGGSGEDLLTDITWGGTPMSFAKKQLYTNGVVENGWLYLYYIINPTSNATIQANASETAIMTAGFSSYYTGAAQTGIPESTGSDATFNATSLDTSLTTTSANPWIVAVGLADNGGVDAGTGMTNRGTEHDAFIFGDSGSPVTPPGIHTIGIQGANVGSPNMVIVSASFASDGIAPPPPPEPVTGSGTVNRLAKFIGNMVMGNALFSDDGSDTTLTSGNLFVQIGALIDTVASGILRLGSANASSIEIGHAGATTTVSGPLNITSLHTTSNCGSVSVPAACGSAPAGSITLPNGSNTIIVNTTAITPNSQVFITEDPSLGARLGVTCNTNTNRSYSISARVPGTSFTIKSNINPSQTHACLNYLIVN